MRREEKKVKRTMNIFWFLCIQKHRSLYVQCSCLNFMRDLISAARHYIVSYCAFNSYFLCTPSLSTSIHLISTKHVLIFTLHDNVAWVRLCQCCLVEFLLSFFFIHKWVLYIISYVCAPRFNRFQFIWIFIYRRKITFIRSHWKLSCFNLSIHFAHCHIMLSTFNGRVFRII